MTKSEFEDLLLRYSKGECTKDENKKINAWFKRIRLKPQFALTAKEKSLLEMKMMSKIETKIETNKKLVFDKSLFPGILNIYLIYGAIAITLTMAAFLSKNLKVINATIQNERSIKSN